MKIEFGLKAFFTTNESWDGEHSDLISYENIRAVRLSEGVAAYHSKLNGWNTFPTEDYKELKRRILCLESCSAETLI